MMRLWGVLLAASLFAPAVKQQSSAQLVATRDHFRWSELASHELDYKHTLHNSTELTAAEKHAIIRFISDQMTDNGETEGMSGEMTKEQIRKYVGTVRVELVALKGDGTRTVLAEAPFIPLCGATGNCSWWIFEFSGDRMRVILDLGKFGNGHEKVIVRPWSSNGYKDIVLGAHVSASERELDLYQYRNGRYRLSACYWSSMIEDNGQPLNRPSVFPIQCK